MSHIDQVEIKFSSSRQLLLKTYAYYVRHSRSYHIGMWICIIVSLPLIPDLILRSFWTVTSHQDHFGLFNLLFYLAVLCLFIYLFFLLPIIKYYSETRAYMKGKRDRASCFSYYLEHSQIVFSAQAITLNAIVDSKLQGASIPYGEFSNIHITHKGVLIYFTQSDQQTKYKNAHFYVPRGYFSDAEYHAVDSWIKQAIP